MNKEDLKYLDKDFLELGMEVYTNKHIEELREERLDRNIIAQSGSQEIFLSDDADVRIFGGKRGGSKTFSLLLEALNDVNNPYFFATLLRKEKDDAKKTGGMIDKSDAIFKQYGIYNKSQQDMTWYFNNGGKLKFDYYSDSYEDFKKRFQGLELSYVEV